MCAEIDISVAMCAEIDISVAMCAEIDMSALEAHIFAVSYKKLNVILRCGIKV